MRPKRYGLVSDAHEGELAELERRLEEVEARVGRLESSATTISKDSLSADDVPPSKVDHALLNRLSRRNAPEYRSEHAEGAVTYAGAYRSPNGDFIWQSERPAPLLLHAPVEELSAVLAALGQSARLKIVQHLLEHGPSERGTLQELIGTASSGQLYHHLNALLDAGVIVLLRRGVYSVRAENLIKLLALLSAAYDLTETAQASEVSEA